MRILFNFISLLFFVKFISVNSQLESDIHLDENEKYKLLTCGEVVNQLFRRDAVNLLFYNIRE